MMKLSTKANQLNRKERLNIRKKTSNVPEGIDTELKKEVTLKKSIAITEDHALRILKRHHN